MHSNSSGAACTSRACCMNWRRRTLSHEGNPGAITGNSPRRTTTTTDREGASQKRPDVSQPPSLPTIRVAITLHDKMRYTKQCELQADDLVTGTRQLLQQRRQIDENT